MSRGIALACVLLVACGHDKSTTDTSPDAPVNVSPTDPLGGLPTGTTQWTALCAQHYGDMISAKFCAGSAPPTLTSLADLEALLGLTVQPNPALNTNVAVSFAGASTGLGLRSVSSLMPRAFLMTPALASGAPNPKYQVLAFSRGEPLVELVANDPVAQTLRFFLVRFHPSCEPSCGNADLQTPAVESGWTGYTIYDDATIKNTTLDCLNCHQPGGPASQKILRMHELVPPWNHWFYIEPPLEAQINHEFAAAHGTESYAGVPYQNVDPSRPRALQQLLQFNGFGAGLNADYDSTTIENEVAATGTSATWQRLFAKAVAGQSPPMPYFTNPYDPAKVQALTSAYQQTMSGAMPGSQMPDLSDTMLASALPSMSIAPAAGLDGHGILVHMCRMCHNSQLDQTISRANFSIDTLTALPRAEKDLAIQRMMLPESDPHHMPPARFHALSQPERDLAVQVLSQ
jgi:hypothetical protein